MSAESDGTSGRRRLGGAGGRANEGGSAHRAGLAAYLAAHGLADVKIRIGDGVEPGVPRWLWFETSSAVDDVRCHFDTGYRWDVQAKRRCDRGRIFTDVVEQWVVAAREGGLSDNDRLVLASRQLSKPLRDLGAVFRRLREKVQFGLLPTEDKAYKWFRVQASRDGWLDIFDTVIAHAMTVEISVETVHDASFREAAALLDGTVVARDSGGAAVDALARFFQTDAIRSGASDVEGWLYVIHRARVPAGPISAMSTAGRARAIAAYRQRLTERRDLLEVDHLAMGIAPLPVPDLLDTFEIELPQRKNPNRSNSTKLVNLARRWPRFAMIGLPGSGKSTALEQLAAAWADDIEAPLPIMVRLRQLVPRLRDRQYISLEDLCRLADATAEDLVPTLVERLVNGTAVLLLDGLDECRDQQGQAVTLVRRLAEQLCPETGLVVTAREVASEAVRRTGFPVTALKEPKDLKSRARDLVEHVSRSEDRSSNEDEVAKRRRWVERSQSTHRDIWRIPLFAVLLAVHAARAHTEPLPVTRAEALVTAIKDSIKRWEGQKTYEPGAWEPELHPDMLLHEFGTIGHEILNGPTDVRGVIAAVANDLECEWSLPPGRARAVADDVGRWWVDRVGVFTDTDNCIGTRLTLMSEVADAMWAVRQTPDVLSEWVNRVTSDPVRYREPAMLAAGLDNDVARQLIDAAREPAALLLAADAVLQGANPGSRAVEILANHLAQLATDPPPFFLSNRDEESSRGLRRKLHDRHERIHGPEWRYILRLVRLPLSPASREVRDVALRVLTDPEKSTVSRALAIVSDCNVDRRAPTLPERAVLNAVFTLPLSETKPHKDSSPRRNAYVANEPILLGRAEAAAGTILLIGLTEETVHAAAQLVSKTAINASHELVDAMIQAGFGQLALNAIGTDFIAGITRDWFRGDWHRDLRFVLEEASTTLNPNIKLRTPAAWWRLTGAATLIETLGFEDDTSGTGPDAVDRFPELVRHLVRLAIPATGLPSYIVADDSQRALGLVNTAPLHTCVLLHVPPDPLRAISPSTPRITNEDRIILQQCLDSYNDWLFNLAAVWLSEDPSDENITILWNALPHLSPQNRLSLACWLAETDREEAYKEWLNGSDRILRLAAARTIGETGMDETMISSLVRNTDLMIRLEVLYGLKEKNHFNYTRIYAQLAIEDSPTEWTCKSCGSIESIIEWDCTHCATGDRPDLREEAQRLLKQLPRQQD